MEEQVVIERRHRDGEAAAEEVADGRLLGEAAEDVVRADIEAVDDVEHRKHEGGVVFHGIAESVLEQPHAHHDFEEQHGNAGIHQRIANPADAHLILPVDERAP